MKENPKLIKKKKKYIYSGSVVNNLPASAEDWVRFLVWEDLVCYRAGKPMHRNYRGCALEPGKPTEAHSPGVHAPQQKSPQREAHAPQREKARMQQQAPAQPKVNK